MSWIKVLNGRELNCRAMLSGKHIADECKLYRGCCKENNVSRLVHEVFVVDGIERLWND